MKQEIELSDLTDDAKKSVINLREKISDIKLLWISEHRAERMILNAIWDFLPKK